MRVRPAAPRDPQGVNWRLDPAVAGGGILTDHGWHVFYIVQRWIGARPLALSARLERRRHATLSVEDTATVQMAFADATAEILLTWAADERRNWAHLDGAAGTLELRDDTLVLTRGAPRANSGRARPHSPTARCIPTGSLRSPVSSWRKRPALAETAPTSPRPRSASCWKVLPENRAAATAKRCPCRRRARPSRRSTPERRHHPIRAAPRRRRSGHPAAARRRSASGRRPHPGVAAGPTPRAGRDLGRVRVRVCRRGRRRRGGARGHCRPSVARCGPVGIGAAASGAGARQRPRAAALAARDPRDATGAGDAPRRCLAGRGRARPSASRRR